MHYNGHLDVAGQIKNLKFEQLAADPTTPALSQSWYNTVQKALKYYDGTAVQVLATGSGALAEYLKLDGSTPMSGALVLSSVDQSAEDDNVAVSKGHVDTLLADKQDTITGAATTIVSTDLTASRAVVTNGSGKVDVATATAAEINYLSGVTSAIQDQLDSKQGDLGYSPLNKAGDSMSGTLAMNNNEITGVAAPTAPTSAARLIDIETIAAGLSFQEDVLGVQVDDTLDPGAEPTEGDRYVITNAGDLNANFGTIDDVANGDIVEFVGGEFIVAYDISEAGPGALAWDRGTNTFVRYNDTSWGTFGGLAGITDGVGLSKVGNVLNVNLGAGVAELPTDEIGIDVRAAGGLFTTEDGTTSSTGTAAQLAIKLDGNSLSLSADGLEVAANGITASHITSDALGDGLTGGSGTDISVQVLAAGGISVGATGLYIDHGTLRDSVLYRDGAEAMTGPLLLSGTDQSAAAGNAAVSKDYMVAQINALAGDAVSELETRVQGGYFLYEELTTPSTSHTVTHNMGTQYVQVTVVDENDEVVVPESITYTSANALTVTFYTAQTCRIIVTGLKN